MKPGRIIRNILLGLVSLVLILLVALQVILRPKVLTGIVNQVAATYVDGGELTFDRVKASVIKDFPHLNFTIDGGALTYPHDRFSAFDSTLVEKGRFPLLRAGRAPERDTLASFHRLTASLNYVTLLRKTSYDIRRVELDRPRIFAHYYDSTAANWNILRLGDSEDTTSAPLPPIRVQRVLLTGRPFIVYTNRQDTLLGVLRMKELAFDGKIDTHDIPGSRVSLTADSLFLSGRLPADTLSMGLDRLTLEGKDRKAALTADAKAFLSLRSAGRMRIPVRLEADATFPQRKDGVLEVLLDRLGLRVATIDLKGSGGAVFRKDSTEIRADASIEKCPLGDLLTAYQSNFPVLKKVRTDAVLDLRAHADGAVAKGRLPRIQAHLQVPDAYLDYEGLGRRGRISVDVDALTDEDLKLDLDLNRVLVDIAGARLDVKGTAADLTGDDPFFALSGKVRARVDSLTGAFTAGKGITGTGSLTADIDGQARLSQLSLARIGQADIKGTAVIRDLRVDDTRDRLKAFVQQADLVLETKENRIDDNMRRGARVLALDATLDTLSATYKEGTYIRGRGVRLLAQNAASILQGGKELTPLMGVLKFASLSMKDDDGLSAGVRDNTETFRVTPSTKDFRSPKLNLTSKSTGVRVRSGSNGALLRDLKFDITANKRLTGPGTRSRRAHLVDSLKSVYPGVPEDSLLIKYRASRPRRALPAWLQEADFRKKDIHISLSDALKQYYRDWDFGGNISAGEARILYPAFPLRTQVKDLRGKVSGDRIDLDNVTVTAGNSDLSARASLTNLRRSILGRGTIGLEGLLSSNFLDANELMRAYAYWRTYEPEKAMEKASDEAVERAIASTELPDSADVSRLLVVPANLDAKVTLEASGIRYDSLEVTWAAADIAMKQRTLQITNALAASNMGDIYFEGFYSTRSKQDIKAGFDLNLVDITAEKVITLFPAVDTLMPMLRSFAGDLDCELAATSDVDTLMNLVLPSIDGVMRISGKDLSISGESKEFKKIAKLLKFRDKGGANVDRMAVTGMVRDNVLEVFPFVLDVDRYVLAASGLQHLDESFKYHLSVIKSPLLVKFGINIWGDDFDHIKYGLGKAKYRNVNVPVFTKQLDTVQYSLLASIHNIFELGVEKAIAENKAQQYVQTRMEETGYSAADTLAAPASVADSVAVMSRRFEQAAVETDREVPREEVLSVITDTAVTPVISSGAGGGVEKSAAKKEDEQF
ncbi:MAG: hypothetical protein IJ611_10305 [Bacteroidales bacterium]|nr:hypothetical protein [Bacteroidales bacterium]